MANRTHSTPLAALVVAIVLAVTIVSADAPVRASGSATAIDPGGAHTCALTSGGELRCWGWNFHGQLGDGTFETRLEPVAVDLPGVTAIASGGNHTCAVSGGDILCWGLNESGQLGDGLFETRTTPVETVRSGYVAIAAGSSHTCAITEIDNVVCWGANDVGQLGNGTMAASPIPVTACFGLPCEAISDIDALSLGAAHTCALGESSGFRCWGSNEGGQIGDGGACGAVCARPVSVCLPGANDVCVPPASIVSISAGGSHTCAVTSDQLAYCWGDNTHGQLGNGTELSSDVPVLVSGIESPVAIVAGLSHTCALSNSGDVSCWGLNSVSQLGSGSGGSSSLPVRVEGLAPDIVDIAAGSSHTCVVTESGALQCWGWNADGRLGDGTFSGRDGPVDVSGFGPKTVTPPRPTPTPTVTHTLLGDVDCDRDVDAIDATLVLQFAASFLGGLPCLEQADVTSDDRVDSIDATVILQFVAGLLPDLPP